MAGRLFVVATPIGNLGDFSPRAAEILRGVALILAEDTRTSQPLLRAFDIHAKLRAYHKFNESASAAPILAILEQGADVALISDAGTPCVSDPGWLLVAAAAEAGIEVVGVSGACAAVTALSVSGFNAASFVFRGFLPRARKDLEETLARTLTEYSPVTIFYESPRRVSASVAAMVRLIPDSRLCLCNDLSKLHERVYRGLPEDVLRELLANENAEKGEYTLVIARAAPTPAPREAREVSLEARLVDCMTQNACTLRDAVRHLSGEYPKNELYAASLRLKTLLT
jgi:16S rRNA (cytidine1402-2'-O)-methyltransferase